MDTKEAFERLLANPEIFIRSDRGRFILRHFADTVAVIGPVVTNRPHPKGYKCLQAIESTTEATIAVAGMECATVPIEILHAVRDRHKAMMEQWKEVLAGQKLEEKGRIDAKVQRLLSE